MASRACWSRILSPNLSGIDEHLIFFNNRFHMSRKTFRCDQVYFFMQQRFKIQFHLDKLQADMMAVVQLNKYVQVALSSCFLSGIGSKHIGFQDRFVPEVFLDLIDFGLAELHIMRKDNLLK